MPNTHNLDEFLTEKETSLPGEGNIKILNPISDDDFDYKRTLIAASRIMVSDTQTFQIPQGSFKVIGRNDKNFDPLIKVYHSSQELFLHKASGSYFKSATIPTLVWQFVPEAKDQSQHKHHIVEITLSITSTTGALIVTRMGIGYNDTPLLCLGDKTDVVTGGETVTNLAAINAFDPNDDDVLAFEVKVEDEFAGKVGLFVWEEGARHAIPKTYEIGKDGLRYSQKDRGKLQLVRLDNNVAREGLAADHVRVTVRACDEYAWGKPRSFHIALKD